MGRGLPPLPFNGGFMEIDEQNILEEYEDNTFYDPELFSIEKQGNKIITTHGQETRPILEMNAELRKYSDEIWSKGKTMKWVGRIPILTFLEWERQGLVQESKVINKTLNRHPDYKVTTKTL